MKKIQRVKTSLLLRLRGVWLCLYWLLLSIQGVRLCLHWVTQSEVGSTVYNALICKPIYLCDIFKCKNLHLWKKTDILFPGTQIWGGNWTSKNCASNSRKVSGLLCSSKLLRRQRFFWLTNYLVKTFCKLPSIFSGYLPNFVSQENRVVDLLYWKITFSKTETFY